MNIIQNPVVIGVIIGVVFIFLLFINVKVVPQSRAYVIERIGKYKKTHISGLFILLPFVDKIRKDVSLKEQVLDFRPQPVITRDNVTIQIDSVIYLQITDPKLYTYGIENPTNAIENLTATTLRNIIGGMDLEETLTSRDRINSEMRIIIDEATDPWGMKITRVELKNIDPPVEIKVAMERQMKADREKRESILRAEGQKQSAILVAEGERESTILRAEAAKEGEILKAEAIKQAMVKAAEGKAEAIRVIKEAGVDDNFLALQALETFAKMADGQATKIIVPMELQNIAALTGIFGNLLKDKINQNKDQSKDQSKDQVKEQVKKQVKEQVKAQGIDIVKDLGLDQMKDQIKDYVKDYVKDRIKDHFKDE